MCSLANPKWWPSILSTLTSRPPPHPHLLPFSCPSGRLLRKLRAHAPLAFGGDGIFLAVFECRVAHYVASLKMNRGSVEIFARGGTVMTEHGPSLLLWMCNNVDGVCAWRSVLSLSYYFFSLPFYSCVLSDVHRFDSACCHGYLHSLSSCLFEPLLMREATTTLDCCHARLYCSISLS